MPAALRAEIYEWLKVNAADERKAGDSDEQFFYKTRKKAFGPFKQQVWGLPADVKATIAAAYDAKFTFLFDKLGVKGTSAAVRRYVKGPAIVMPAPGTGGPAVEAAPDDAEAGE
jgi:hypothetical protein